MSELWLLRHVFGFDFRRVWRAKGLAKLYRQPGTIRL